MSGCILSPSFFERLPLQVEPLLSTLVSWVEIESPSSDLSACLRMLDQLMEAFRGFPVEITPPVPTEETAGVLRVSYSPAGAERKKGLLFLCHVDTVHPVGTLQRFPVKREGDLLYGPGVYDMKGGILLGVSAFQALSRAGCLPHSPITFLFTTDEEIGSFSSRAQIEEEARRSSFVFVLEPAREGGKVVTSRYGSGMYTFSFHGEAAHAGMSHAKGVNAIAEAAHQVLQMEAMTDYALGRTVSVDVIKGGTVSNVIPDFCSIEVDLRVATAQVGQETDRLLRRLTPKNKKVRMELAGGLHRPPFEKTAENAKLFAVAQRIASLLGFSLQDVERTGGVSDANFVAALGIPVLDGLGVDGQGAHTLEEQVLISSILPRTQLLAGLLYVLGNLSPGEDPLLFFSS